jgi:hypothetical protein
MVQRVVPEPSPELAVELAGGHGDAPTGLLALDEGPTRIASVFPPYLARWRDPK